MVKAIQIQHNEYMKNALILAKKSGFSHVSMGFGSSKVFHEENWESEILYIRNLLDELELECIQTHLPYYDLLLSSEIEDKDMEIAIKRCIKATGMLGADFCVHHPRSSVNYGFGRVKSLQDNVKSITQYIPVAEESNVIIALENLPFYMPDLRWKFYPWNADDLCELIDSLNSPNIGACWDFGHGHMARVDQKISLETLGSRLVCTHIHDNSGGGDEHLIPMFGNIDWEKAMQTLKTIGYEGPLTLEVNYLDNSTLESFFALSKTSIDYIESMIAR